MKIVQRVVSLTLAVLGLGMLGLAPSAQATEYNPEKLGDLRPGYEDHFAVPLTKDGAMTLYKNRKLSTVIGIKGDYWLLHTNFGLPYLFKCEGPLENSKKTDGIYNWNYDAVTSVATCDFQGKFRNGYLMVTQLTLRQVGDDITAEVSGTAYPYNDPYGSSGNVKSGTYGVGAYRTSLDDFNPKTPMTQVSLHNVELEFADADLEVTVVYKDADGNVLKTDVVKYGENSTPPEVPNRAGYVFIKWDHELKAVKDDIEVFPVYHQLFTVKFVDADGTELKTETVEEKLSATAPDMSGKMQDGYRFAGWDKAFDVVTENLVVTATYGAAFSENPVWSSGLVQGKINKANDFTTDILATSAIPLEVVPGTIMADCQANDKSVKLANPYTGTEFFWNDSNTTFGYFGYVYLAAGDKLNFCKNIDDSAYVKVGESVLINDTSYTQYPVGTFTAETTGWYPVEVRVGDGSGGKGPAGGKIAPLGLGYNVNGKTTESATGWEAFVDPGNEGQFLKTIVPGAEPMLKIGHFGALENGDVTVELAAQNLPKGGALYALYGAADAGDDLVSWKHAVELAKVPPAGLETATYTIAGLSNHAAVRFAVATEGRGQKIWQCSDLITFTQKVPLVSLELGEPSDVAIAATIGYEALGEGATSATVKIEVADNPDFENSWFVDCGTMSVVGGTAEFSVADLTFATGYTVRVVVTSDTGATYVSEPQSFQTFNPYVAHEGDTLVWNGGENGTWDDTSANWLFGPNSVSWIDGCVAEIKTPATITLAAERRVIEIKAGADVTFNGADLVLADGAKVTYQKDATVRFENDIKATDGLLVSSREQAADIVAQLPDAVYLGYEDRKVLPPTVKLSTIGLLTCTAEVNWGGWLTPRTIENTPVENKEGFYNWVYDSATDTVTTELKIKITDSYETSLAYLKILFSQGEDGVYARVLKALRFYGLYNLKEGETSVWDADPEIRDGNSGDFLTDGEAEGWSNAFRVKDFKAIVRDAVPSDITLEIVGDCTVGGTGFVLDKVVAKTIGTGTLGGGICASPILLQNNAVLSLESTAQQKFTGEIAAANKTDGTVITQLGSAVKFSSNKGTSWRLLVTGRTEATGYSTLPNNNGLIEVAAGGRLVIEDMYAEWGPNGGELPIVIDAGGVVECARENSIGVWKHIYNSGVVETGAGLSQILYRFHLCDGGRITGETVRAGYNAYYGKWSFVEATGSKASAIEVENLVIYGANASVAAPSGLQLIVDDVTGDAASDLVVSSKITEKDSDKIVERAGTGLWKQGEGTVEFSGAESACPNGIFRLEAGTVRFAATASGTYGALELTGDASIEIVDGAKVAFAEDAGIAWETDATLNITGKLRKGALHVGALTAAQLAQITYEGKTGKVYVDENGCLRANTAMVLSIR